MREKIREIVERYKKIHKSGLNLNYFDNFEGLKNKIRQNSMFKEKKLAVVINLFSSPDFKERFFKEKKEFLDSRDVILIYQQGIVRKNDSLFKFLEKNGKSQEFNILGGQKLKKWVEKKFEKYGSKTDFRSQELLINYVGGDLWRMSNEIKKLASYKKEIGPEDVKFLVKSKIETDVFKTIDAIAQKNKKGALGLIRRHLEKGDSPLYLLSMINYQFRNLLAVKDFIERSRPYSFILRKSGLHPFVVKKSYNLCQKFSFQELKEIYGKIFQTDLNIKTGRIEPETALDMLIAQI